jgi:hypothetical protein
MTNTMIVRCRSCGEEHDTNSVEFVNIEEDIMGRDKMYFVCPNTSEETDSLVFLRAY